MVRYVKNEGRPALGFAVESEESDESSDDEPLSDQPSLATLVSENPGSPPDSQAPFVPKSERRRSSARVSFKEDMAFVDRQGYTRDSENLGGAARRRAGAPTPARAPSPPYRRRGGPATRAAARSVPTRGIRLVVMARRGGGRPFLGLEMSGAARELRRRSRGRLRGQ